MQRSRLLANTLLTCAALASPSVCSAQQSLSLRDGQVIPLWNGPAPSALGTDSTDIPAITVFLTRATAPNTPAVIVCPGGAYARLASNHEGRQIANYFNSLGVAAFVLRYRLGPRYHHPVELGDAQRAVRYVRAHAVEWHLDSARIGIVGFSAGGHLAMTASTLFADAARSASDPIDRVSSRPDFAVLGYPVISMVAPWTHTNSRDNLLGPSSDPALATRLSGERAVTKDTPATFLFLTNEDTLVPAENSVEYFLALRRAGVPAELHVFAKGPHGVGLANDDVALSEWSKLVANWLRGRGVIQ